MACGAYRLHDRYKTAPIRVAVVNALNTKIEDFVEALQRQLARKMNFKIEVVRERQVRVVSEANLDAAVKIVEKETPDLMLFFLPDADAESETYADYVKNLSLGRGLPSHIVFASAVDDPDAMPGLIVQILARTGNTPAALADPLEGFDAVVGVDLVRRTLGDTAQIVAIARAYTNNGTFVNYAVRAVDVTGDQPPYLLMRGLFNQKAYANKRVVLHVNGRLPDDVKKALVLWGQAIRATFAVVEIVRRGAPRIYAFDEGKVTAPPVGSAFYPDEKQAFLVLTSGDEDESPSRPAQQAAAQQVRGAKLPVYLGQTPQPVHLLADGIPVRQALESVRRWALLDYSPQPRGIPATILNTDALAYWLGKGGTFAQEEGDVPFWL
jgi:argonaute-like protein implicated in RNA metabolism and viral defense